jgi:polyisoprenoid-binding protein YceI
MSIRRALDRHHREGPDVPGRTERTAMSTKTLLPLILALSAAAPAASAQSTTYAIDPAHTFPAFEADHMGMSLFRGKFDRNSGRVVLDRKAGTGTVSVDIDLSSIHFGNAQLDELMAGPDYFDTAQHPAAHYEGKLVDFVDGKPTRIDGTLTFRGVTRPVPLEIRAFKCMPHPVIKRDWCGADAYGHFDRGEFGITAGKDWGFSMDTALRIQAEAIADEEGK